MLEKSALIQVGDFVDAQDARGIWYEAVVRETTNETVKVHFCGWSSKWDRTIPVSQDGKSGGQISQLWSKTPRWRENITVGDLVEVRDSFSLVDHPKWIRGVVKWIGGENDATQCIMGGAALENLSIDDDGNKGPLLLLHRTQQVLVQVEQDYTDTKSTTDETGDETHLDPLKVPVASPPHLRWVNLYGEEICRWSTHLHPHDRPDFNAAKGHPKHSLRCRNIASESQMGSPVAIGSVGLHNLGNTCYMNAILQSLNQIETLTSYFIKQEYFKDLNKTNPLGTGGTLALSYVSLINQLWTGKYSIVSPIDLQCTVAKFATQFNNTYQHDSHEFLSFFLDGLHEDLNRVKDKPCIEAVEGYGMDCDKAAVKSWKNYLLRHDSIFVDHFHGMQKSHLTCPVCGKESIKFDVYSSLSLNLDECTKAHKTTLLDCFDKFTEGELLDATNAWYCPKCRKHVCAKKVIQLWTTPDILILHLKRFAFKMDKSTKQGHVRTKIQEVINCPVDNLDLKPYVFGPIDVSAPPIYKLIGVVEHSGFTVNSGHYTATVRNMNNQKWYRFNDTKVGVTTAESAINGNSYLLFYERSNGKSKWAGMEKFIENFGRPLVDSEGFTMISSKKNKKRVS